MRISDSINELSNGSFEKLLEVVECDYFNVLRLYWFIKPYEDNCKSIFICDESTYINDEDEYEIVFEVTFENSKVTKQIIEDMDVRLESYIKDNGYLDGSIEFKKNRRNSVLIYMK